MRFYLYVSLAALLVFGVAINVPPNVRQLASLASIPKDSKKAKTHFSYFKKRQWLADARTIASGYAYLWNLGLKGDTDSPGAVTQPPPQRPLLATNFVSIEGTVSCPPS
jgi:hypothetical protein